MEIDGKSMGKSMENLVLHTKKRWKITIVNRLISTISMVNFPENLVKLWKSMGKSMGKSTKI
jgi:hypothetical protein